MRLFCSAEPRAVQRAIRPILGSVGLPFNCARTHHLDSMTVRDMVSGDVGWHPGNLDPRLGGLIHLDHKRELAGAVSDELGKT
jgi:hypothetical protein